MHGAGVALEEHLGNARRAAEVAVDLEGRMEVEQVRVGALRGQEAIDLVRLVAGDAVQQRKITLVQ